MDFIDAELARAQAARDGFICWRMADVPSIYGGLMPLTYNAKTLWEAEKVIRRQLASDIEFAGQPWRRVGPDCKILDLSELTTQELMQFGLEVSVPLGHRDVPKPGRHEEVENEVARMQEDAAPLRKAEG